MTDKTVSINTEYIKLDSLLKWADVVQSGGMAKELILNRLVSLNDEVCTMRGKKIRSGDCVSVHLDDQTITLNIK